MKPVIGARDVAAPLLQQLLDQSVVEQNYNQARDVAAPLLQQLLDQSVVEIATRPSIQCGSCRSKRRYSSRT